MVHRSRRSKTRKRIVPRKTKRSVKRKRRGGFKTDSLSRKTCTEVLLKKPGFSRGHYSACKWLRPDLYKETKKGVFDWTRRSRPKKAQVTPTPFPETANTTTSIPISLSTPPSPQSLTTVTQSVADSPPRSVVETTTTTTEPIFMTSSSQQDEKRNSESSVDSRPLTETLGDLKLEDEWAQAGRHSGGRKNRLRQSRSKPRRSTYRKTRRNSTMTHFFRA